MHTLDLYGHTADEVIKAGFSNIHIQPNQTVGIPMELVLANTIYGLSDYIHREWPDLLIVHGDRVEALAGSIVGALQNVRVGHVEGGELSGTIDESIRHAVSKMSHLHFVANDEAATRLLQLGEVSNSIFVIGSPDLDLMASQNLDSIDTVKAYYEVDFDSYAIAMYHPVTTELDNLAEYARAFVDALVQSDENYIVIYPNNDEGSGIVMKEMKRLEKAANFLVFPSIRFEYFLTLMKNSIFIVGNSSAGIREASFYGLPSVNVGSRQRNRFEYPSIINVDNSKEEISKGIKSALEMTAVEPSQHFAGQNSSEKFIDILLSEFTWQILPQKQFNDIELTGAISRVPVRS